MQDKNFQLNNFNELVTTKYKLYNGLFLTLPYEELEFVGQQLPIFANQCATMLEEGKNPTEIVEAFIGSLANVTNDEEKLAVLFRVLQLVERQVVLFDALEEAAFSKINDMSGAGTLDHLVKKVGESGVEKKLAEVINDFKVRIVLTAHPTQFYPEAVLEIISALSKAINENKLSEIKDLLLQLGKTKFKNPEKPTPFYEATSIINYLKQIFYEVFPQIQKNIVEVADMDIKDVEDTAIELGFWPGGDRDGNPFVVSQTTRDVANELKVSVLAMYLRDVETMQKRLTFEGVYPLVKKVKSKLRSTIRSCFESNTAGEDGIYENAAEFVSELLEIRTLVKEKHRGLFIDHVDSLLIKAKMFGFFFASMDLRQDSGIHEDIFCEIFTKSNSNFKGDIEYSELDFEARQKFLEESLAAKSISPALIPDEFSEIGHETLKSVQAAKDIQRNNGAKGLHRYIISNTQAEIHLFEVIALTALAGWEGDLTLDVTPLFETIDDLQNSEGVMSRLYENEFYKGHLASRGNIQYIMLGFSDGTKDGGYITANWSIYKAKVNLTRIARKYGIKVVFFDGRGGPPARGGGNTHKFYRSLGKAIEHDRIQLTIQGQTISSNFGHYDAATYNMEELFTAGLDTHLFNTDEGALNEDEMALIEELSQVSLKKYLDFKGHELFVPYLEELTPLKYYDRLNIGSRPAKRKKAAGLQFKDLRAIPFVGSWSQIKQNIPGFFGIGSGIKALIDAGKEEQIKTMYNGSLFFTTLVENAMQSLKKTRLTLTQYLEKDERFGSFWTIIKEEAELSIEMIKRITGIDLLGTDEVIKQSVEMREQIVLPLLVIQQYALEIARKHDIGENVLDEEKAEAYRKLVVKSLAANINASRNSA